MAGVPAPVCCTPDARGMGEKACEHSSVSQLVSKLCGTFYPSSLREKLVLKVLTPFLTLFRPLRLSTIGEEYIVDELSHVLNDIASPGQHFSGGEVATLVSNARTRLHENAFPTVPTGSASPDVISMNHGKSLILGPSRDSCLLCHQPFRSNVASLPSHQDRALDGQARRSQWKRPAVDAGPAGPHLYGEPVPKKPVRLLSKRCVDCVALAAMRAARPADEGIGVDVIHFPDHAAVYARSAEHGTAPFKKFHFMFADFDAPGGYFQASHDALLKVETLEALSVTVYNASASYEKVRHARNTAIRSVLQSPVSPPSHAHRRSTSSRRSRWARGPTAPRRTSLCTARWCAAGSTLTTLSRSCATPCSANAIA
jgi:hypothetical protein